MPDETWRGGRLVTRRELGQLGDSLPCSEAWAASGVTTSAGTAPAPEGRPSQGLGTVHVAEFGGMRGQNRWSQKATGLKAGRAAARSLPFVQE